MGTSDEEHDHHDAAGTTHEDYRWKGLSTAWSLIYGFGFPLYLILTQVPGAGVELLPGMILTLLFAAWGGTVVYVIGPGNIETWQELTGE